MRRLTYDECNPIRPVIDDDFKALSEIIGRELPNSVKDFYTNSNGGWAEESMIYDDEGIEIFGVSSYYRLIHNIEADNSVYNVFVRIQMKSSDDMKALDDKLWIPIGCDGASNELYLDFNYQEPTVCICFYDLPDEEAGTPYTHFEIAENLEEFVNSLEKDRGDDE